VITPKELEKKDERKRRRGRPILSELQEESLNNSKKQQGNYLIFSFYLYFNYINIFLISFFVLFILYI
jgi:hypothetical protein